MTGKQSTMRTLSNRDACELQTGFFVASLDFTTDLRPCSRNLNRLKKKFIEID